ncbi:MAG: hypothetical protein HYX84_09035 [Chloroflexi bacterium]|nr:hypothetical protein [Chloroflexota bacterium]
MKRNIQLVLLTAGLLAATLITACSAQNTGGSSQSDSHAYREVSATIFAPNG